MGKYYKTLLKYLADKYGYLAPTMTKAEAICLGIRYPLKHGWMQEYGGMEITYEMEKRLKSLCFLDSRAEANKVAREFAKKNGRPVTGGQNAIPLSLIQSKDFYLSVEWEEARYQALKKSKGKCECCGASKKDGAILHVDHIRPKHIAPELALSVWNLQVLCAPCNRGKSYKDTTDWRI